MAPDSALLEPLLSVEMPQHPAGACLYHTGEKPTAIYWLRRGQVELVPPAGPVRVVRAPALLGAELLHDPVCRHTARVKGEEPAVVCSIDVAALRQRCDLDFRFRLSLLRLLSKQTANE